MTRNWQDIAKAKRAALLDSIPAEWRIPADLVPPETQLDVMGFPQESGFFTNDELKYTSTKVPELLQQIHSGKWKAVNVTSAFCKRAAVCHELTNCLSETLFPKALERAKALDDHFQKTGKPVGPLHGLPISLKDNFNIIGKDSTIGFVSWVDQPATYNTVLVDVLTKAGAVLYVKTNVPTAMMIAESVNNTFGRTVNPQNRSLTSGGSSGGESALIKFGGSAIGVGTDIGGSLRIPAACTGIFTLRPSFGRFPTANAKSGLAGQEAVNSVNGPMARTLNDIEFFAKNVPTPPVRRALKHAVDKLQQDGHEIVEWKPELHSEAVELLAQFFVADGGKSVKEILAPVDEPFREEMLAYKDATEIGVHALWQLQAKRTKLCKDYLDRWTQAGLDGILCPTTPFATVEHGKFKHVGYTGVFNILDYSAVSFPSGIEADKQLDKAESGTEPLSQIDAQIQAEYNAEAVHGMPVSLQLVANRLEEEKAVAMTRVVMEGLGIAV
ncbi:acetamidase, partial [Aureobasidium melanogenum]